MRDRLVLVQWKSCVASALWRSLRFLKSCIEGGVVGLIVKLWAGRLHVSDRGGDDHQSCAGNELAVAVYEVRVLNTSTIFLLPELMTAAIFVNDKWWWRSLKVVCLLLQEACGQQAILLWLTTTMADSGMYTMCCCMLCCVPLLIVAQVVLKYIYVGVSWAELLIQTICPFGKNRDRSWPFKLPQILVLIV